MTTGKTDVGRVFKFLEHRSSIYNAKWTVAVWRATCASCQQPFEITSPRLNPSGGRIDAQMAFRSGVWRKYFSVARCPSCRKARRT